MSIVSNSELTESGEFAEGLVSLTTGTWFCTEHEQTVRVGRECAWCVFANCGEAEFNQWAVDNAPATTNRHLVRRLTA